MAMSVSPTSQAVHANTERNLHGCAKNHVLGRTSFCGLSCLNVSLNQLTLPFIFNRRHAPCMPFLVSHSSAGFSFIV
jgi:hypothetical protein